MSSVSLVGGRVPGTMLWGISFSFPEHENLNTRGWHREPCGDSLSTNGNACVQVRSFPAAGKKGTQCRGLTTAGIYPVSVLGTRSLRSRAGRAAPFRRL